MLGLLYESKMHTLTYCQSIRKGKYTPFLHQIKCTSEQLFYDRVHGRSSPQGNHPQPPKPKSTLYLFYCTTASDYHQTAIMLLHLNSSASKRSVRGECRYFDTWLSFMGQNFQIIGILNRFMKKFHFAESMKLMKNRCAWRPPSLQGGSVFSFFIISWRDPPDQTIIRNRTRQVHEKM